MVSFSNRNLQTFVGLGNPVADERLFARYHDFDFNVMRVKIYIDQMLKVIFCIKQLSQIEGLNSFNPNNYPSFVVDFFILPVLHWLYSRSSWVSLRLSLTRLFCDLFYKLFFLAVSSNFCSKILYIFRFNIFFLLCLFNFYDIFFSIIFF